ncbi:27924_t:CDS:2, partial [Gigaspora margarita]
IYNKDTNQLKNSLSYHDKSEQYKQRNGIEIEEQALQPRRLIQKENFSRGQPVNKRTHLKRPYQGLNNSRTAEKDKNTRDFSQYNYHKRVWKPKEDKAQLVESVDLMWDSFEEGILFAAKRNISFKKILSPQENSRTSSKVHRTDLYQDMISLSQISRKIKKYIETTQIAKWYKIFQKTNKHLREINNRHKIEIQLLNIADIAEIRLWLQDLKEVTNLKEIENFIELRCKCIQNEQGKMLNSLLDRPYNKVKINRVLDQKEENLLTHFTEC